MVDVVHSSSGRVPFNFLREPRRIFQPKNSDGNKIRECSPDGLRALFAEKSACEKRLSLFRYLFVRGKSDPGGPRFFKLVGPGTFSCRNYSKIIGLGRAVTVTFALYMKFSLLDSQIISQTTKTKEGPTIITSEIPFSTVSISKTMGHVRF